MENTPGTQRKKKKWVVWIFVAFFAVAICGAGLVFLIISFLKNSDAYKMAESKLLSNPEAVETLGAPISFGMPMGSIRIQNSSGTADLSIPAIGTKNKGVIYIEAIKVNGTWTANRLDLVLDGSRKTIDLNTPQKLEAETPSGKN